MITQAVVTMEIMVMGMIMGMQLMDIKHAPIIIILT